MKSKVFTAQEVQSIIAGNKTMFREVIKVQPANENQVFSTVASSIRNKDIGTHNFINPKATWEQTKKFKCPYKVGQKIFVKESFNIFASQVSYKQGLVGAERYFWKPAQHMKQEHSRLTLEITEIKVEKLKEIYPKDVYKEGLPNHRLGQTFMWFEEHWNASHKKPEEKFEVNPFVWVVNFKINNLNK